MKHYKQNITAMITGMAIGAALVAVPQQELLQTPRGRTSMWMVSRYP